MDSTELDVPYRASVKPIAKVGTFEITPLTDRKHTGMLVNQIGPLQLQKFPAEDAL